MSIYRARRNRKGSNVAEFGPAMWVFFVLIVLPLLNLLSFGSAMATIMLIANLGARNCAGSMTFTDAKNTVDGVKNQLGNFLAFSKCTPIGTGVNTAVCVTDVVTKGGGPSGGTIYQYSQRTTIPTPVGAVTSSTIYQYMVTSNFEVLPVFNFSGTPLFKDVPLLGKAVPVTYTATSTVEHPEGLNR